MKWMILLFFLKLLILLYADDTVLMTENHKDMQTLLNFFSDYCNEWKLKINVEKTKSMIIGKCRNKVNSILNDTVIENVTFYKYLGCVFSQKWKIYILYETTCTNSEKGSICITPKDTTIKLIN